MDNRIKNSDLFIQDEKHNTLFIQRRFDTTRKDCNVASLYIAFYFYQDNVFMVSKYCLSIKVDKVFTEKINC